MALNILTVYVCRFRWSSIQNGIEDIVENAEINIPGAGCGGGLWRIEVKGDTYKTIRNFEPLYQFTDSTLSSGRVGFSITSGSTELNLESFEVVRLP